MQRECRRVYYSGRVQGVGFRYSAHRIARGHDVGGFVRNLPDGRVELVAEGDHAEIEAFLRAVEVAMDRHIRGVAVASCPPSPTPPDEFTIRYD